MTVTFHGRGNPICLLQACKQIAVFDGTISEEFAKEIQRQLAHIRENRAEDIIVSHVVLMMFYDCGRGSRIHLSKYHGWLARG